VGVTLRRLRDVPVKDRLQPPGWDLADATAADAQGWEITPMGLIDDPNVSGTLDDHHPELTDLVLQGAAAGDPTCMKAVGFITARRLEI
jgi:hypothetical protein